MHVRGSEVLLWLRRERPAHQSDTASGHIHEYAVCANGCVVDRILSPRSEKQPEEGWVACGTRAVRIIKRCPLVQKSVERRMLTASSDPRVSWPSLTACLLTSKTSAHVHPNTSTALTHDRKVFTQTFKSVLPNRPNPLIRPTTPPISASHRQSTSLALPHFYREVRPMTAIVRAVDVGYGSRP